MNFNLILIISAVMFGVGIVANILAKVLEKKYKEKMNSISNKK